MIRFFAVMLLAVSVLALHGRADTSAKEKEQAIVNSLGMQFVPVSIPGGKPVLMCIWKTRVKDFDAFVSETHYDATREMHSLSHDGKGENNAANWKRPGFDQTELNPVCGINY
ncbi:MAG: Serine/threonine protein kinase, partial [Phycisphaerales bacterium]|nr:Serine/threonine protein kinase [Phycisphaerales bacterium]